MITRYQSWLALAAIALCSVTVQEAMAQTTDAFSQTSTQTRVFNPFMALKFSRLEMSRLGLPVRSETTRLSGIEFFSVTEPVAGPLTGPVAVEESVSSPVLTAPASPPPVTSSSRPPYRPRIRSPFRPPPRPPF